MNPETHNIVNKAGIFSSIALGIIFSAALISLIISVLFPELNVGLVSIFSNIWLIKIFKIHAGLIVGNDILSGINLADILILFLFILICLSLSGKFRNYNAWCLIACSLLALGIIVYLMTRLAGRSSFMASGLIISSLLYTKKLQKGMFALTGILANLLLLLGDFAVGSGIIIIPYLFGAGFILEIAWIISVALNLRKRESSSG